jgi:hypothetical protein
MARRSKFGVRLPKKNGNKKKSRGRTHGAWQALDRGRRERKYTCSPNLF